MHHGGVGAPLGPKARDHVVVEKRGHLSRYAGYREDEQATDSHLERRGRALPVSDHLCPVGVLGLAQVRWRHAAAASLPSNAQLLGVLVAEGHLHAPGETQCLAGEVVLGGPDAAGDDERVGPAPGEIDRRGDPLHVVADDRLVEVIESCVGETGPDGRGVRVDGLAQQQLRPDGEHLDDHLSRPIAAETLARRRIRPPRRRDRCRSRRSPSRAATPPARHDRAGPRRRSLAPPGRNGRPRCRPRPDRRGRRARGPSARDCAPL